MDILGEKQRARTAREKDRRRDSIVNAALELFLAAPGKLPTMSAIASRAGVAKGTAYIYFDTKEAIYLALVEQELDGWLSSIEKHLSYHDVSRANKDELAQLIDALMGFLQQQPHLWPLASLSHTVIETNIDSKVLLSYKTRLAQKYRRAAQAVREHLGLPEKFSTATEAMLTQSYAYLLGNWQVCNPPASISRLLKGPGFRILQPDFAQASSEGLTRLWAGFIKQQRTEVGANRTLGRFFSRRA